MIQNVADIYIRLSDQDRNKKNENDESESIQNQRKMLVDYCRKRKWQINGIYCDEDYSGADRSRPAWNRVLKDCEEHKCTIVLCKTQSRFSRDMEMVEKYIHGKFLEWGVRFVSVVDNADTDVNGNKLSRLFNGLIDEMYLDGLSNNVKATLSIKRKNGEFVGSFAPYGYLIDPNNKNHLIIDEIAAPVVQRIFDMYINGAGYIAIAKALNDDCIPPPCERKKQLNSKYYNVNFERNTSPESRWSDAAVYTVLRRREYTGALVQGRETVSNYKTGARRKKPEEEWDIAENAHEAIISTETFEAAQEIRKKRGRSQKIPTGECYSLARKVFCGECGNTMWKNTCIVRGEKHSYLACRTRKTSNTGCDNKHQIDLNALEDVILSKLNELLALYYNKKIIGKISAERHVGYNDTSVLSELKVCKDNVKRNATRLDKMLDNMLDGILPKEEYEKNRKRYLKEIEDSNKRAEILKKQLAEGCGFTEEIDTEKVIDSFKHIDRLTFEIADKFIERVTVYKIDEDGKRRITVEWKI